jgi:hypothetical protein
VVFFFFPQPRLLFFGRVALLSGLRRAGDWWVWAPVEKGYHAHQTPGDTPDEAEGVKDVSLWGYPATTASSSLP